MFPRAFHSLEERELTAIEKTAADWLVRRDRGLSAAESSELARWRQTDARHGAVFAALESTWTLMGEATPNTAPHTAQRSGRWRWIPVGLAAALAIGAFWSADRGGFFKGGNLEYRTTATTEIGAWRRLDLPDGSVVQLNTDSRLEVQYTESARQVRVTRGEAHFTVARNPARPFIVAAGNVEMRAVGTAFNVRLRAEAVEVLVTEGMVKVAAGAELGRGDREQKTREKRTREQAAGSMGQRTDVAKRSVMNASGMGDDRDGPPLLSAGQRLVIPIAQGALAAERPAVATVEPHVIQQALAWQRRRLDFESAPLPEMVAEINRYNRHQLVIADPRLDTRRFGGSFPAGDYEAFVRLLEINFGVLAERKQDEILLRLAP